MRLKHLVFILLGFWGSVVAVPAAFPEYTEGMEAYRRAWAAYATQDFAKAEEWAEQAVRADSANAHAVALLGNLAYLRHDLTRAKELWGRALKENPGLTAIQGQIAQADTEMTLENRMKEAVSRKPADGSLVLRVPKDLPLEQEETILATLSKAMAGLEPYFQYRVNRPLTVLIYPQEVFYEMNHVPMEVLGLFDGKIRIPEKPQTGTISGSAGLNDNPAQLEMVPVLWHEYTHAVVFDLSHGRAPRWLQEGLAQEGEVLAKAAPLRQAPRPDPRRDRQGERLLESVRLKPVEAQTLPPLRALLGIADPSGEPVLMPVGQFYSASKSLVQYLLKTWGWDRMRQFLAELGGGVSVEEALGKEYGLDLLTLEKKWTEWYHSN